MNIIQKFAFSFIVGGLFANVAIDRAIGKQEATQPSTTPSVALWGEGNDLSVLGADIVPLSVERPTAGRVVIRGVTFARIQPDAPSSTGVAIALASMAWSVAPDGVVVFDVESQRDYTIHTAVMQYTPDGDVDYSVASDYQVFELPRSRAHKIQRFLEVSIEAENLKNELGTITFFELSNAIRAISQEQEDNNAIPTGSAASARHFRDIEERNGAKTTDGPGAEPQPGGSDED